MPRGVAILLVVSGCSVAPPTTPEQIEPPTIGSAAPRGPHDSASPRGPDSPRTRPKPRGQVVRDLAGVTIGQPIDAAIQTIMGDSKAFKTNDAGTERNEWKQLGYHVESEIPFLVGFDTAYTFDTPRVPIYMLFAKDGKVVLIRASAYVTTDEEKRKVRIADGCGLDSPTVCTELTFLDKAIVQSQPYFGRDLHHWPQHGVSMTVENDGVRLIDVYGDIEPSEQARMEIELRKPVPEPTYYE